MRAAGGHILTVDAARGAFAIGVMVYHLLYWQGIASFDRLSFYCVYAFFVISGFALYVTYSHRLASSKELQTYLFRRFRRIAPLFYLTIALSIWVDGAPENFLHKLALNLTFAFGLANPGQTSIPTGGWSIGIEMVFYLALPLVIAACGKSLIRLSTLTLLSMACSLAFIDLTLGDGETHWIAYTQPIAFGVYFTAGCLIGELYLRMPSLKGSRSTFVLAALALLPFVLIRADTAVDLIVGWTGFALMTATIVLVASTAFMPEPKGVAHTVASWVGRISYPVYLLHPIAAGIVGRYMGLTGLWAVVVTILLTVVLSDIVNRQVEQRVARLGRVAG